MATYQTHTEYDQMVHRIGKTTLLIGLLLTFTLPLILWLFFGIIPTQDILISAFISTTSIMLPTAIIEILTYAPLLGSSGLYITTLTGSYMNLRIPSALSAIEAANVEKGSEEADLISTIGIAMSAFVSIGVLILAVIDGSFTAGCIRSCFATGFQYHLISSIWRFNHEYRGPKSKALCPSVDCRFHHC